MHKNIWLILVAFCLNSRLVWSMERTIPTTSQQFKLLKRIARNPAAPIEIVNVPPELKDRFTPVIVRKSILSLLYALDERYLEDTYAAGRPGATASKKKKNAQVSIITVDQIKLFTLQLPSPAEKEKKKRKKKKKQKTPKLITFVHTANTQTAEGTQYDAYIEAFKQALNTQSTDKHNEVLVTINVKKLIALLQHTKDRSH